MTPDQINQLLMSLDKISENMGSMVGQQYTLTGAADWPILVALGGLITALVAFMWVDLRSTIREHRSEQKNAMEKEINIVWGEMRRMQRECDDCKKEVFGGIGGLASGNFKKGS